MSWSKVEETIKVQSKQYLVWLEAKEKHRADSKKYKAAFGAWVESLNERAAALLEQWDPEKDGYQTDGASPSLARTLQRYYTEKYEVKPTKTKRKGKR